MNPKEIKVTMVIWKDWTTELDRNKVETIHRILNECASDLETAGITVDYWTTTLDSVTL